MKMKTHYFGKILLQPKCLKIVADIDLFTPISGTIC